VTSRMVRDRFLPPDQEAYRQKQPSSGRVIVIAPTRAACETIELALRLDVDTLLEREHGSEIRSLARRGFPFGIVAGTGTGKTLSIKTIALEILGEPLRVGVVNREREATPETPTWNVVIVTTGIARRWFQGDLIRHQDTLVVDEIHQTSAELELCLALGKRLRCRFVWLSATVDPSFYARYLGSAEVLETSAFDPSRAARVTTRRRRPLEFLDDRFLHHVMRERRGVAVFLPTRAEVEGLAGELGSRWGRLNAAFYHGGEPIRVIRPFLEGTAPRPFLLAMTAAGQSALNIAGLDTVVISDARYANVVEHGRNVLRREYLGANEILQMAGRVHGRVPNGEVYVLTDRDIDFDSLLPTPPEFQLAGDTERVALTAAAIGVDLAELELPVPLDKRAYRASVRLLEKRGLIAGSRLTEYGRDVEAMPVERPWGELLFHAPPELIPFVAVAANIESLHRMTRDERDLHGLVVHGSDHLTAYNVFADAVNDHGYVGLVYQLPRHLFADEMEVWAGERGVLVKAIEDIALGMASVYRTLEMRLPERLPRADSAVLRSFRELLARIMPFDLVIDGHLASGESARVSRGSMCSSWGAIAGDVRYFADRHGVSRAAIEGTNIPLQLIRRYATHSPPTVELRRARNTGLSVVRRAEYAGFELESARSPLTEPFPPALVDAARDALAEAVLEGQTGHPDRHAVKRAADRLAEYWRRSAGQLERAAQESLLQLLRQQLRATTSWGDFLATRLTLDVSSLVPDGEQRALDALPSAAFVLGDKVPLTYEIEGGVGVVRVRLKEGQARRLRARDLPDVDRPLRLSVLRGRREVLRAGSLDELRSALANLPRRERTGHRRHR
jgi:ATP-dependent helicase HrpA